MKAQYISVLQVDGLLVMVQVEGVWFLGTPKIATIYLWELDVVKKKQLVPPNHPLPLSHSAQLVWIG